MSPLVKIALGLAAALLLGWIVHGPLGRGEAFVDRLEAEARAAAARAELPGIEVSLARDPLARTAIVSGVANDVQREGMGSGFGVKDHVRSVPGIAAVRWDDESPRGGLPLLVETLAWVASAYLVGVALGGLLARRRRRRSFLD
jgi:hypothetical protein